jgi:sugar phosphate permease
MFGNNKPNKTNAKNPKHEATEDFCHPVIHIYIYITLYYVTLYLER